jgi:hypothetical protein
MTTPLRNDCRDGEKPVGERMERMEWVNPTLSSLERVVHPYPHSSFREDGSL